LLRFVFKFDKFDKTPYACKVIKKGRSNIDAMFAREFEILKRLHHPNCVRLIGAYEDLENYYLVMTQCLGGELFGRVKSGAKYTEKEVCTIIKHLLSALQHLHNQNIVHRDLKPENCLFDNEQRISNLRLIDFGSAFIINDMNRKYQELAGTPYYMSPEAVRNVERTGEELKATDIWSAGVITYILLCGKPPFGGKTTKEIFTKILSGKLSWPKENVWSDELKDFLRHCLTRNMRKRTDVNSALQHPWFDQVETPEISTFE